jgi:hypothetical protein
MVSVCATCHRWPPRTQPVFLTEYSAPDYACSRGSSTKPAGSRVGRIDARGTGTRGQRGSGRRDFSMGGYFWVGPRERRCRVCGMCPRRSRLTRRRSTRSESPRGFAQDGATAFAETRPVRRRLPSADNTFPETPTFRRPSIVRSIGYAARQRRTPPSSNTA